MTEPVTLIDRLRTMRVQLECPHCGFPRARFDLDTITDAIHVIGKFETILTREEREEIRLV